jgi:hypothetical protein
MKAQWIIVGIGVAALGMWASQAGAANMTISVQVAPGSSDLVGAPGAVVNLNVYAILKGGTHAGDVTQDAVQWVQGALMSTNGGLLGDLSFTLNPSFTATGGGSTSSSGTAQTLDGDTDKDVGGKNASTTSGWIIANSATTANPTLYIAADGNEMVKLGTATFTVGASGADGQSTTISWSFRNKTTSPAGTDDYLFGGVEQRVAGNDASLATGPGVTISFASGAPEPVTMVFLALGGLALLRRNRKA